MDLMICLIVLLVVFRALPFKVNNYQACYDFVDRPGVCPTILIPRFGFNHQVVDNTIKISYFRSYRILNKEIKQILNEYEKIKCDNQEYYQYEKNAFYMDNFEIEQGLLINTLVYHYTLDNPCEKLLPD